MKKAHGVSPENFHTYWEYPAPTGRCWSDRLREHIEDAQSIGIEPSLRQEIINQISSDSLRVEPLVERLRLVKTPTEVEMIRRAALYADYGVERLLASSYYGASVAEGFTETRTVTSRIIREVRDWEPLTTKVMMATWAAPGSAMPHSIPDLNDRLRDGPHVAMVLTRVNGYAAESERTYFTASPSTEAKKAFDAMTEARRIAFELIRPGLACSELDGRVNDFLQKEGYGSEEQRLHRTGHGFGLGNHEAPWIAEGSEDRLAENMVISIEPGIYLEGIGGVRHSDTVLVTKDGFQLLTQSPMDFDSLVIRKWKPFTRSKGWMVRRALRLTTKNASKEMKQSGTSEPVKPLDLQARSTDEPVPSPSIPPRNAGYLRLRRRPWLSSGILGGFMYGAMFPHNRTCRSPARLSQRLSCRRKLC